VAWEAVFFNANKAQEEIPHLIDIVYNIEKSWWNGEEVLRLTLCDFVPSGQPR